MTCGSRMLLGGMHWSLRRVTPVPIDRDRLRDRPLSLLREKVLTAVLTESEVLT